MLLKLLDSSGDDVVELAEFEALFAQLDADRDQTLTAFELGFAPRLPVVGDLAPDFELPSANDRERSVKPSSFRMQKPVALIFGSYT